MKHHFEAIGKDIDIKRPLTCSNGLKIQELDLNKRRKKTLNTIQRQMSKKQSGSKNFLITQQKILESHKQKNQHKKTITITKSHTIIIKKTIK